MNCNDSPLVLPEIPTFLWDLGLIFAGVGAFIIYEGGRAPAMDLIFAAIGPGVLLFTNALTIRAERTRRTSKLEYHSAVRIKQERAVKPGLTRDCSSEAS